MVGLGMAERRKSEGRSSSSGSKEEAPTRGTAPSAGDIDELERFEPSEEAKRHKPSDRRRDGPGQAPGGRRPLLRAVGPQPDHVLRRRRGCGGHRRRRLAGPGVGYSTSRPLISRTAPPGRRNRPTRRSPPSRPLRRSTRPIPAGSPAIPTPSHRRAPAHRRRRPTPSRATPQTSRSATARAARLAQPDSARSSLSRVTGIRHLSAASSTIFEPADRIGPSTEPTAS